MTEAEWLSDPPATDDMLAYCANMGSERKLRLVLHACCCRIEHALTDARSRAALAGLVGYIEGAPDREQLLNLRSLAVQGYDAVIGTPDIDTEQYPTAAEEAADAIVRLTNPALATTWEKDHDLSPLISAAYRARRVFGGSVYYFTSRSNRETEERMAGEAAVQVNFLRDIFGNPFRPVAFAPEWRTDTAIALARTMYESREFGAMPILADELQDAGCDSDDILDHCRDTAQVHVRGCWVCDLVLGKS
jgi:hypothetical protein